MTTSSIRKIAFMSLLLQSISIALPWRSRRRSRVWPDPGQGSGSISLSDGSKERLRCRATYQVSVADARLQQSLRCASDSYRFDLNSDVVSQQGTIAGTWSEASRGISGSLAGRASSGSISAVVDAPGFSANLSVTTRGNQQSFSIVSQGDIRSVAITMVRELRRCRHLQPAIRRTIMCVNRFAKLLIPLVLAIAPIPAFCATSLPILRRRLPSRNSTSSKARRSCRKSRNSRMPGFRPGVPSPSRERRGAGAKVVDLSFDGTPPRLAYRVKVLLNEALWEGTIDASTGAPVGDGSTTPVSRLGEDNKTTLAAFAAAGMDLSETIAVAEKYGSGRAVSAGLQHNGAKLVLLVVIVSEGSLKEVSVEPGEKRSRQRKASVREKKWKRPSSGATSREASA